MICKYSGCIELNSINIPRSIETIGNYAFVGCSGLTSIYIPKSIQRIKENPFANCNGIKSIVVESGNTVYDSRDNCNAIIETPSWYWWGVICLKAGCQNTIIPNNVTEISWGAFAGCTGLKAITIPNTVDRIGVSAFADCSGLNTITIPNSVTSIGTGAFAGCSGLTEVISQIKEPFEIDEWVWNDVNTSEIPLYVPFGTKEIYENTAGWNVFANIIEKNLSPVDEGEVINIGDDIDANTSLDGNVVGDVFFNINDGNYSASEGCIVVNSPTDDSFINGQDIFGDDFKEGYNGIVFMVPAGEGTINVEAETTGDMVLKVKIGNKKPITMVLNGRLTISFPYDVTEDTYVYIYGGTSSAGAKGMKKASGSGSLKIYGIKVESGQNGIEYNNREPITNNRYYNLNGQKVNGMPTKKGVYIKDGKKVLVK